MSETKTKHTSRNLNFLFIVGLILAILIIIFAIQNSDTTPVEFLGFQVNPPTALLIIACIAVGSALTLLFSIPGWWNRRKTKAALKDELKQLRKQYEELAAVNVKKEAPAKPES